VKSHGTSIGRLAFGAYIAGVNKCEGSNVFELDAEVVHSGVDVW